LSSLGLLFGANLLLDSTRFADGGTSSREPKAVHTLMGG